MKIQYWIEIILVNSLRMISVSDEQVNNEMSRESLSIRRSIKSFKKFLKYHIFTIVFSSIGFSLQSCMDDLKYKKKTTEFFARNLKFVIVTSFILKLMMWNIGGYHNFMYLIFHTLRDHFMYWSVRTIVSIFNYFSIYTDNFCFHILSDESLHSTLSPMKFWSTCDEMR